ncbi:hypothetical protein ACH5RR_013038 [Cinchona calisaya]|uniref:Late embryogenesis abundant protein n=1 Tax=Cinchona calisaya TaxID=153742 RepID=A0ABD3A145_9GENT
MENLNTLHITQSIPQLQPNLIEVAIISHSKEMNQESYRGLTINEQNTISDAIIDDTMIMAQDEAHDTNNTLVSNMDEPHAINHACRKEHVDVLKFFSTETDAKLRPDN